MTCIKILYLLSLQLNTSVKETYTYQKIAYIIMDNRLVNRFSFSIYENNQNAPE